MSHAWKYLFLDVVESLEDFFSASGESDSAVIWFDLFTNSQHGTSEKPFEWWTNTFLGAIGEIGSVVMVMHPWDNPVTLTRAWCIFEIYS